MRLIVTEALFHPGQEYRFHDSQAIADQEIYGEVIRIDDTVVDGVFMADQDGNINVRGSLRTVAHGTCANCLAEASQEITSDFEETFIRGGDPEDDELFTYEDKTVDLEKLVMSYTVMALPIRFLCGDNCPGIEFHDPDLTLNPDPDVQHPFAALSQLLIENEEV